MQFSYRLHSNIATVVLLGMPVFPSVIFTDGEIMHVQVQILGAAALLLLFPY